MSRCKACNAESYRNLDKYDGLCGTCYSASESTFIYSLDHEFANLEGSAYTTSDAIKHHINKDNMLSNWINLVKSVFYDINCG